MSKNRGEKNMGLVVILYQAAYLFIIKKTKKKQADFPFPDELK